MLVASLLKQRPANRQSILNIHLFHFLYLSAAFGVDLFLNSVLTSIFEDHPELLALARRERRIGQLSAHTLHNRFPSLFTECAWCATGVSRGANKCAVLVLSRRLLQIPKPRHDLCLNLVSVELLRWNFSNFHAGAQSYTCMESQTVLC